MKVRDNKTYDWQLVRDNIPLRGHLPNAEQKLEAFVVTNVQDRKKAAFPRLFKMIAVCRLDVSVKRAYFKSSTSKPAAIQAAVPPSIYATSVKPICFSR